MSKLKIMQKQLSFLCKVFETREELTPDEIMVLVDRITTLTDDIKEQVWSEAGMLD